MATAKKSTAVALPENYEVQQAADVAAFRSRMGGSSENNRISVTQDKKFKVGDTKTDSISGIIVDFVARKNHYEGAFDKDNVSPPTCFAIGFAKHDNLIPSENSPEAQADACRNCALNKFEKLPTGKWKPKVCKDSYRLALIAPDDDGQAKLFTLDISSTGVRDFEKYVASLSNLQKAPYNVVTDFSFDPKSDYPSVRCVSGKDTPVHLLAPIASARNEAVTMIQQEPKLEGFQEKVVAKRLPAPKKRKAA
jgi:hypothetical protein